MENFNAPARFSIVNEILSGGKASEAGSGILA
jgi:hypothetical protein